MTDRYAVLGNPVEHSQSPFIHAEFARDSRQDVEYVRVLSPLDAFGSTVRAFAAEGGRGCNVTVPFKFEAFALAPRRSARAELAQAANTLRFDAQDAGGWWADNTDGVGLLRDIECNAGIALQGKQVLLIGAGGAAAGVLGPLLGAGPRRVMLANRGIERAHALAARHAECARENGCVLDSGGLDHCGEGFDVVINASASSLSTGQVPVQPAVLAPGALAVDLMYGPAARNFVEWALSHGALGRDGLGMLVEQAAEAFFLWRGVRPATGTVLSRLRERLSAKSA
jgi:shikimate dehydrogenase